MGGETLSDIVVHDGTAFSVFLFFQYLSIFCGVFRPENRVKIKKQSELVKD